MACPFCGHSHVFFTLCAEGPPRPMRGLQFFLTGADVTGMRVEELSRTVADWRTGVLRTDTGVIFEDGRWVAYVDGEVIATGDDKRAMEDAYEAFIEAGTPAGPAGASPGPASQ